MRLVHLDGVEHGCCGPAARTDAEAVARIAGIPFEIADMTAEFDAEVIGDFVAEHAAGRTPNPCARCNAQIKFGAFLRRADELGVDLVATGHYVRSSRDDDGRWHLRRAADPSKDQSYMLHLARPARAGALAVPARAGCARPRPARSRRGSACPSPTKPDSQELCFAPSGDAGAFLRRVAPELMREGDVVDPQGRVLATHGGAAAFTVGQRRGLGVSGPEPRYVLEVDAAANRIVVGPGELLARRGLVADRAGWVAGQPPADGPFEAEVRLRYRGEDVRAVLEARDPGLRAEFRVPQRGVAPGQSVVVYRGEEVLGGARILEALR